MASNGLETDTLVTRRRNRIAGIDSKADRFAAIKYFDMAARCNKAVTIAAIDTCWPSASQITVGLQRNTRTNTRMSDKCVSVRVIE